ncbi:MAG: hypothetical protein UX09_C0019G0005 [Candidatus Uhrbacteria bacterium GW2011_GWE2_45_35]|uniref:Uncharacterized protein n=2 Tax=Candidatus Uhriibacteriota TaxID=1752732 RepID=A0A0G1MHA2_9BACT|nr:MAG: hypothetical protein UW63_C0018G0004 [Candidatus Uhrbacteria bacterium GW2011_GWF2_44_350]KKU08306.1 MAG: hypothetical protein UX09_C0019G0005 [Candidatus Uhrbacteria bacterium GW2011_GWE2_45_35]HBR81032.1 hypothetical protein [Candidatus Uhrbacteria bacterium]HCU31812.1 hypothetical protein [Candidatus Uhrbacteria bacterium]
MKKLIIVLLALAVLILAAFFIFKPVPWLTYQNTRYEFSLSYPDSWTFGEASVNNDGQEFVSPDKSIVCRVYGFQNALTNDSGQPQTLSEFVDWFAEGFKAEEIFAKNYTSMAGQPAQELIIDLEGATIRVVFILNEEIGRSLDCVYSSQEVMSEQAKNFEIMQKSFEIEEASNIQVGTNDCSNLLSGAITPFKDLQTFIDSEYTEVTITSREDWDASKLPKQVKNFESQGYVCYPMPLEFDYSEQAGDMLIQPEVKTVEWSCELGYQDWKYLAVGDSVGQQAAEKAGLVCEKESCFADGVTSSEVWFCAK